MHGYVKDLTVQKTLFHVSTVVRQTNQLFL